MKLEESFVQDRDDGGIADPIDRLENRFGAHGWSYERPGEDEIVASMRGAWAQYELRAVRRDRDSVLQFLGFPDLTVGADKVGAIFEAIGLVNEQLWLGHFELWSSNGTLLFRHAVLLADGDDGAGLTADQAEALIETAVEEMDRFYPVFQFVLWGGKTPKEALAAAMVETHGEA